MAHKELKYDADADAAARSANAAQAAAQAFRRGEDPASQL